jgi:hypothetical protein
VNNKNRFLNISRIGFVSGAMLVAALTGYSGNAGAQSVGITVTPPPIVAPPVVVEDNYLYYPGYGIYFNSGRHQYAYLQGDSWVTAPAPVGVSLEVLQASPSVKMDWHDGPEHHHKEMQEKYPKNWSSPGGRDEHGGEGRK